MTCNNKFWKIFEEFIYMLRIYVSLQESDTYIWKLNVKKPRVLGANFFCYLCGDKSTESTQGNFIYIHSKMFLDSVE